MIFPVLRGDKMRSYYLLLEHRQISLDRGDSMENVSPLHLTQNIVVAAKNAMSRLMLKQKNSYGTTIECWKVNPMSSVARRSWCRGTQIFQCRFYAMAKNRGTDPAITWFDKTEERTFRRATDKHRS